MATGIHWEWRGFGELEEPAREKIASLPLLYPTPAKFHDRYLWIPGCPINVKLRRGVESGLKFKRFLDRKGQLELWEERADELYAFPLEPAIVDKLTGELGIELPRRPDRPIEDDDTLLAYLERSEPRVHVIEVEKLRTGYRREVSALRQATTVIVEVAEIRVPQPICSVALEETMGLQADSPPERVSAARYVVAAIRDDLGLPGGLRAMNYLDALEIWARGETIGPVVKRIR